MNDDMHKSYVPNLGGVVNDLAGQLSDLHAAISPAVAAGMPVTPGKLNPGETTGAGDGSMVTEPRSQSGSGEMIVDPVAGTP